VELITWKGRKSLKQDGNVRLVLFGLYLKSRTQGLEQLRSMEIWRAWVPWASHLAFSSPWGSSVSCGHRVQGTNGAGCHLIKQGTCLNSPVAGNYCLGNSHGNLRDTKLIFFSWWAYFFLCYFKHYVTITLWPDSRMWLIWCVLTKNNYLIE
jgi:hypothetical protein